MSDRTKTDCPWCGRTVAVIGAGGNRRVCRHDNRNNSGYCKGSMAPVGGRLRIWHEGDGPYAYVGKDGKTCLLTDDDIAKLADEAEAGYDVSHLKDGGGNGSGGGSVACGGTDDVW